MKTFLRKITSFHFSPLTFPLFLLAVCLAAYAPFITRLGFYWDDFPINWIASTMGSAGLTRYFATNRPVWGLVYRLTTAVLGSRPIVWQGFGLLMRWLTGSVFWLLLRSIWPKANRQSESRETFAAWAAILFVVYPGFSQQFIAFLYSHFEIILTVFLLSLLLMVLAQRQAAPGRHGNPTGFWLLTGAALALSLFNMLSMEYFFLLDLLRPLILWILFSDPTSGLAIPDRANRLKHVLRRWLPYLVLFAVALFWRSVLFGFQTYQPALMSRIKAQPIQAILALIPTVLHDVWVSSVGAWLKAFSLPQVADIGARNMQRYTLLVAAGAVITLLYLLFYRPARNNGMSASGEPQPGKKQAWAAHSGWAWQPIALGVVALFIAGGPFWLTDLKIGLVFPNDRFTLPFMIGASLLAAGLLVILPLPKWTRVSLLAVAVGFAIGLQNANAVSYTRDWATQRSLFWQMVWRMPDIQPGTILLSNELPVTHYTDNSLSAPLNWTYDPQNDPHQMNYLLTYPTLRKDELLNGFQKNTPVELNYLATTFYGNTGQMVAFYFNPPGCLRVLDPEIDIYNWMVPLYLKESLALSTTAPILPVVKAGKPTPQPPEQIYGAESAHGWCYYYEKADLARQVGDWTAIVNLGHQAFSIQDYPNDPLERFPFIEGYAHTGNWEEALQLTQQSYAVSPEVMRPMLCKLWERIERNTESTAQQNAAFQSAQNLMECSQATSLQAGISNQK